MFLFLRPIKLLPLLLLLLNSDQHHVIYSVTLPTFSEDKIILKQKSQASILEWPGLETNIQILSSRNKKKYQVISDVNSSWKTKLVTPTAGGPYEITISNGKPLAIINVLIGELSFFDGQSHLEIPWRGFNDLLMYGSNDPIIHSTKDQLRVYVVPCTFQRILKDTS